MRLQRIVILLLALGLIVGSEFMLMNHFTGSGEVASAPVPTAVPTEEAQTGTATQAPIPTPGPTMPGFTSPPVGGGNSGGSSSNNNNNSSNNNNNNNNSSNNNNNSSSSATKKPDPTAKPTDPPPPTTPPGTTISDGSFSSNTGTNLNLSVSWEAKDQGSGTCRVYINGTINSYSLNVASHPVSISLGSYSTSTMGKSLNVPEGSMTSSSLFSTYIDVPSGTSGTMTVSWRFGGTYSGVDITDVVASGSVYTS